MNNIMKRIKEIIYENIFYEKYTVTYTQKFGQTQ